MATRPGIVKENSEVFPMAKETYMMTGKKSPNVMLGHLKKYSLTSLLATWSALIRYIIFLPRPII